MNPKRKGYYGRLTDGQVSPPKSTAGIKNSDELGTEDKSSAKAIAGAIQAWKILKDRRTADAMESDAKAWDARWIPPNDGKAQNEAPTHSEEAPRQSTEGESNMRTFPAVRSAAEEIRGCPFAPASNTLPPDHSIVQQNGSGIQRPDSLPTPPELTPGPLQQPAAETLADPKHSSPPPSTTGSASKCPIRFLDHHSPEEVAEYFQNHKHEVPRSHEICVKRYQSNVESIRQLDAKYGNLVSMIQGLGAKHQPLLPSKSYEHGIETDRQSQKKIEQWAQAVKDVPKGQAVDGTGSNAELNARADKKAKDESDARQGHFERPLKEIRVGESPSRPWGISVPLPADTQPSASSGPPEPRNASSIAPTVGLETMSESAHVREEEKRMVFTGPVFVGYSAEDAARLLQQSKLREGRAKD